MIERPAVSQEPVKSQKLKFLFWIIGILLLFVIAYCVGLSLYVGWSLTHPEKTALTESPHDYHLAHDHVTFMSRDGKVRLSGWNIAPQPDAADRQTTLIFAHGYKQNRLNGTLETLQLAKDLTAEGFTVLLFDFRNAGESEGDMTSVGYFEKQDLLGAVDFALEINPHHTIGVIGFSMGAATGIIAAAEDKRIAAVVADSPFHDLRDYLKDNLSIWSDLPYFPFTPLIISLIPPLTGTNIDDVSPIEAVQQVSPRPILFIHSTNDERIPHTSSESMYNKDPNHFQYWETHNEGHAKTYNDDPQQYVKRVVSLFDSI